MIGFVVGLTGVRGDLDTVGMVAAMLWHSNVTDMVLTLAAGVLPPRVAETKRMLRFDEVVERHRERIVEHIESIRLASQGPGISSSVMFVFDETVPELGFTVVLDEHEQRLLRLPKRFRTRAKGVHVDEVIPLIDECFDLLASSRLAAAKAESEMNAMYRSQEQLLTAFHELDAIDDGTRAAHSRELRCLFNATKLRLARRWLDEGRDEAYIDKVTRKLYRGAPGATAVAAEIRGIIEAARDWGWLGNHPGTGDPVFGKSGPNGRMYVQLGRRSESFPKRALRVEMFGVGGDPQEADLEQALKLIDDRLRKTERRRPLGVDPDTGRNVYAKEGQWGGFVQLGEHNPGGPRPKIVSLPDGVTPEDVDLQAALDLLDQVVLRNLGDHPEAGLPVMLQTDGLFGPLVSCEKRHATIPESFDPMAVTLEEAVCFLAVTEELRLWLRESSDAIQEAASPPHDVLALPKDLEPIERQRIVAERKSESLSSLTESQRGRMLDMLERVRTLCARVPREAHARGDIGTEDLER